MTRIIKINGKYNVQDRFLWFWVDKTAVNDYGNNMPCTLTGFDTLQEALDNCQTTLVTVHSSARQQI